MNIDFYFTNIQVIVELYEKFNFIRKGTESKSIKYLQSSQLPHYSKIEQGKEKSRISSSSENTLQRTGAIKRHD